MAISGNADVELLRAIAHARMFVTSGRGLESVVHQLASSNLGRVSQILEPALERMASGEGAEAAMRGELEKEEDPHMRAFLSALIASGKPGLMRLDELSSALHMEREAKAEQYGSRLTGIVDITTALFVFSFLPTLVRVLGRVPNNPIIPTVRPGAWFEWVFYAALAIVLTTLLAAARVK
jgi:hypothetical protein